MQFKQASPIGAGADEPSAHHTRHSLGLVPVETTVIALSNVSFGGNLLRCGADLFKLLGIGPVQTEGDTCRVRDAGRAPVFSCGGAHFHPLPFSR